MTEPITRFIGKFAFLSNFYPCEVEFQGLVYSSVEHAYQASKTTDQDARKLIRNVPTPGQAKRLGRRVPLRHDWEHVKLSLMACLLRSKFQQRDLKEQLLATGDAMLVEGNTWGDTFWGVCRGCGANHLGKLLMQIRKERGDG